MSSKGVLKRSLATRPSETTRLVLYDELTTYTEAGGGLNVKLPAPGLPHTSRLRRAWDGVCGWIGETGVEFRPAIRAHTEARAGDQDDVLVRVRSWGEWGREKLSEEALVIPLLMVTFSCALADGITLKYYSTFATSMTGNTVLLAMFMLGAVNRTPIYAAVSLAGFLGAGLLFGQLGNVFGNQRRWWMLLTLFFQILVLSIAALVISDHASPALHVDGPQAWVYVFLIGLQGGPQVTMAVNAGVRELPTAMMTTPYAALISDPDLFSSGKHEDVRARNRRFIYIVIFWLGAFLGAILARWSTMSVATLVVAGLKVLVSAVIMVQRGEREDSEGDSGDDSALDEDGHEGENGVDREESRSRRRSSAWRRRSFAGGSLDPPADGGESSFYAPRIRGQRNVSTVLERDSGYNAGRRRESNQVGRESRRNSRDETRVPM